MHLQFHIVFRKVSFFSRMWVFRNGTALGWNRTSGLLWKDMVVSAHNKFYFCNVYIPPHGMQTPLTLYHQVMLLPLISM